MKTAVRGLFVILVLAGACTPDAPPGPSGSGRSPEAASATQQAAPFVGDVAALIANGPRHMGAAVEVTGLVGAVAEGGPLFALTDANQEVELIVLIDEVHYSLDWLRGDQLVVTGTLYEFSAENVDRAGSPVLEGHAVVRVWPHVRYLVITSEPPLGAVAP